MNRLSLLIVQHHQEKIRTLDFRHWHWLHHLNGLGAAVPPESQLATTLTTAHAL